MTSSDPSPLTTEPPPASESPRGTVTRAILPSAGFGTRMHPFSWVLPKELVPLGCQPALHFVLDEVEQAGLTDVAIITRPGKQLLVDHLRRAQDEGLFQSLAIEWVTQPEALGLGDAISHCADFVGENPFALLWPDNVSLSPDQDLAPMVRLFENTDLDVFGVLDLDAAQSERYGHSGLFDGEPSEPWEGHRRVRIRALHDKKPGRLAIPARTRVLRTAGRIVAHSDLLEEIERCRRDFAEAGVQGELDEVPAFQRIVARRGAWGLVLKAPLFDTGHPRGVLEASTHLAARAQREAETPESR